jgi:hypothetical protein
MSTTKPRAPRVKKIVDEIHDQVIPDIPVVEAVAITEVAPTPEKKQRKKHTGPPTEKQLAAREKFKENVAKAKQLCAAEPGLKYNTAIKRVYGKTPS